MPNPHRTSEENFGSLKDGRIQIQIMPLYFAGEIASFLNMREKVTAHVRNDAMSKAKSK